MRATRDLRRLERALVQRVGVLQSAVATIQAPVSGMEDRVVAWCVIEALNTWSAFVRSYYLSATIRARRRAGGKIQLTQKFNTPQQALVYAIRTVKNSKYNAKVIRPLDEPRWYDPNVLLTVLTTLGASNIVEIRTALSHTTYFFTYLPTIRHFYAHRSMTTMQSVTAAARVLGLSPRLKCSDLICSPIPLRPQHILLDWLDDIRLVGTALCN
jgi:hypothetical protein